MKASILLFATMAAFSLPGEVFAQAPGSVEFPFLVLGEGSIIRQKKDLHFGPSFQKAYCDGYEVANFYDWVRSKFATNCCQIFVDRKDSPEDLTLKTQVHTLTDLDIESGWIELDSHQKSEIVCNQGKAITTNLLESAFGDVFYVEEVVDPRD